MPLLLGYCILIAAVGSASQWTLGTQTQSVAGQEPTPKTPAQEPEPGEPARSAEVIVTATRDEQQVFDVPRSTNVIDAEELRRSSPFVALDALRFEPGIWLEHRTGTTADPVIRGLSGANLLALINGNSLSTFWGEGGFAGDDMYGKVDPYSLERIEVVRGPASVLYGSNALGGVINFITRKPPLDFTDGEERWGGEIRSSFASNGRAIRERVDLWGAGEKMRWRVGGTYAEAGNYSNGDGRELSYTGGQEGNLDLDTEWKLSDTEFLTLSVQDVHRDPVYRHYRTTQSNRNDRFGISAELRTEASSMLWDRASARIYFQDKKDRRYWDDGTEGIAHWETYSTDLQAELGLGNHSVIYGLGFHLDRGESPDDEQFTMYPPGGGAGVKLAPDSDWWNVGAFVQDDWAIGENWSLLTAARLDQFLFRSEPDAMYQPPPGSPASVDDIRSEESALTGGLALTRHIGDTLNVYGSWYRGFRQFAPNFGIRQHGWGVLVPNGLLEPVSSDTWELGARYEDEQVQGNAALYYTDFSNFQNIVAGTYQGSSYYDFDGDGIMQADERVYQVSANGEAFVTGIELSGAVRMDRFFSGGRAADWSAIGGFMWNFGDDETNDVPLRHTHPARGISRLLWEPMDSQSGVWASLDAVFVAPFTRIDPARLQSDVGYLVDPQDPSSGLLSAEGLPGYSVFHLSTGFETGEGVMWVFAIDNVLDKQYRSAHSRVDSMGRSFRISVTIPF